MTFFRSAEQLERALADAPTPLQATLPRRVAPPLRERLRGHWWHVLLVMGVVLAVASTAALSRLPPPGPIATGGSGGNFVDGREVHAFVALENPLPFRIAITGVRAEPVEWLSPQRMVARIGSIEPGVHPEDLPRFRPFYLDAGQSVNLYLTAKQKCPRRVMRHNEHSWSELENIQIRVDYRFLRFPRHITFGTGFPMRYPTTKECPASVPIG